MNKLNEVKSALEHISTLRKRADEVVGMVDSPHHKALNMAVEKATDALVLLTEVRNEKVDVKALKNKCLSEIKIGGMSPQITSQFDEHMRLTIDYLASRGLLRTNEIEPEGRW